MGCSGALPIARPYGRLAATATSATPRDHEHDGPKPRLSVASDPENALPTALPLGRSWSREGSTPYSDVVEVQPGRGVPLVALGAARSAVESELGHPSSTRGGRSFYDELDPALVVGYGTGETVELIEIAYSGTPDSEVTLRGIQLTYRPMDDVLADLRAAGYVGRPSDIG